MFVCLTTDLAADPAAVVSAIGRWLGVGPSRPAGRFERHNPAAMPRWPWLQRLLLTPDSRIKKMFRNSVPERYRGPLRRRISTRLLRWNERPFEYPELNDSTRRDLRDFYASHNARLRRWLHNDLAGWS